MKQLLTFVLIGYYISVKYRTRVGESSYMAAAKQLRKQGVPLHIARLILL